MRASSGCDVPWRDEVLTRCSGSPHPSSLPIEEPGHVRVSAPPVSWCHALVALGVVRHHLSLAFLVFKFFVEVRSSE